MPHFVCLLTFTEQGASQLAATTKRSEAFDKRARQLGANVICTFWTLGQYDVVCIFGHYGIHDRRPVDYASIGH